MRISDWSSDVCSSDLLHRGAQLVDGNRRLLLRIAVLHGLDDDVDVDRFTAFDQVAAEVVTERIAQLAFLGRGILGRGSAGDQGHGSEGGGEQTQLHSVHLQCLVPALGPSTEGWGRTSPYGRRRSR